LEPPNDHRGSHKTAAQNNLTCVICWRTNKAKLSPTSGCDLYSEPIYVGQENRTPTSERNAPLECRSVLILLRTYIPHGGVLIYLGITIISLLDSRESYDQICKIDPWYMFARTENLSPGLQEEQPLSLCWLSRSVEGEQFRKRSRRPCPALNFFASRFLYFLVNNL
jgi:hypothetical protein